MWAIIGGTGLERFDEFVTLEELNRTTPFGTCSSGLKRITLDGHEALFLPRHGEHHEHTPTNVDYRSNIYALKWHGATKIMAISATGSLREALKPGELVIPRQYIDYTKCRAIRSFAGDGFAAHVSLAKPVSEALTQAVKSLTTELDFTLHFDRTYICIEGPGFSTQAESHVLRMLGGDVVGMTNAPEYILAREAGIHYLPCSFVTDYDCWDDTRAPVSQQEVSDTMRDNNRKALQLIQRMFARHYDVLPQGCVEDGLQAGLLTPWEHISAETKAWLNVLMQPRHIPA